MPRTGHPKTELILSEEEREQLLRWSRRAKSSQALALRSRIILGRGEGLDNKSVAEQVACSTNTVSKWRARFVAARDEVRRLGYPESFVRMWEFYLCYCEGGFDERHISDVQMLLAKPGNRRAPLVNGLAGIC